MDAIEDPVESRGWRMTECDACGVNTWDVLVGDANGWKVCFTCIAEFVKETDATQEAFEWWIENERGNV